DLHFICDRVSVRVESNQTLWTQGYQSQQVITLPIAHGEGRYFADEDTLKGLEDNGQILFRYSNAQGELTADINPNGSLHHIAGITNGQGNVLGMMPHPERAADRLLKATDGLAMFVG
ncbi:phosphoribosylformylglycinamidine synthase subunit PurQ, partial [Synechocystis sp. LEGE 06083]|uniref:phosphoribosylformylglycinamidine synthase subunit PurQ n=1 Tax=Synechocystis sp. LEGE 06083 TaxID=915336 RepID=UPI00187E4DFF